jgi:hypothetical protein
MTTTSDGSRLFSFRLSGDLREWLEGKAKDEQKSITDVIIESLRFLHVKDSILRHLRESSQRNRSLAELFETRIDGAAIRQLYDFQTDSNAEIASSTVLSLELIERQSQNRLMIVKYDEFMSRSLDALLQGFALRYFREWLDYEAKSAGDEYLRVAVYGREFVLVNAEICPHFGPTLSMLARESADKRDGTSGMRGHD